MNILLKILMLASVSKIYGQSGSVSNTQSIITSFLCKQTIRIASLTAIAGAVTIAGLLYARSCKKYQKQQKIQLNLQHFVVSTQQI